MNSPPLSEKDVIAPDPRGGDGLRVGVRAGEGLCFDDAESGERFPLRGVFGFFPAALVAPSVAGVSGLVVLVAAGSPMMRSRASL